MSYAQTVKDAENAVREHFLKGASERVLRLINMANHDLYFGPIPEGDCPDGDEFIYPGFVNALNEISAAIEVTECWVDTDCDAVMTSEPQGEEVDGEYYEPNYESIFHFERKDAMRAVFGKELGTYF